MLLKFDPKGSDCIPLALCFQTSYCYGIRHFSGMVGCPSHCLWYAWDLQEGENKNKKKGIVSSFPTYGL